MACLGSETFGPLNPYTASQVFRVLLYGGENQAHRGTGFWAFFAIMGSLLRRFPEGKRRGAALEPWAPTAYITAKALFPIEILCNVCQHRGDLYEAIRKQIENIDKLARGRSSRDSWQFASQLDELSMSLSDASPISLNSKDFIECADKIHKLAGQLRVSDGKVEHWKRIKEFICDVLRKLGHSNNELRQEAKEVVKQVRLKVCDRLKTDSGRSMLRRCGLHLDPPNDDKREELYWKDHKQASAEALKFCEQGLRNLEKAARLRKLPRRKALSERRIGNILVMLRDSNRRFAEDLRNAVRDAAAWCHSVVDRESAHASAKNYTDFDPAELVNSIATAVRWNQMTSPLEVSDAIGKALEGSRTDGSWSAGQPFYSSGRVLGAYAGTSDIIWALTSGLARHPDLKVADVKLNQYVEWLQRSISQVWWSKGRHTQQSWGWASERSRQANTIDLWATTLAINALFEIGEHVEYRLWELCKQRFSVVPVSKSLKDIEPVDLGAKHEKRLHRRLSNMARDAENDKEGHAEYSFILHGPPGSSKTVMAQALSREMWRDLGGPERRRLIRITPADFTRHGEGQIDSEARFIFELLRNVRGVTVFFDEVDDLLRKRELNADPTFIKLIVPAMLNRLADLRDACPRQQICFLIGTNFIENIEPALIRPGRIDAAVPVVYPDVESREAIVQRHIAETNKRAAAILQRFADHIVTSTAFWPWITVDRLCKEVAQIKLGNRTKEMKRLLEQHRSQFANPDYQKRLKTRPICSELMNEFINYKFAGGKRCGDYASDADVTALSSKDLYPGLMTVIQNTWNNQGRG